MYKTEPTKARAPWQTTGQVEVATAQWVDWIDHRRFHQNCGDIPPNDLETAYYAGRSITPPAEVSQQ